MPAYPWIFQNILENVWTNSSDYAMALNMDDQDFEDASGSKKARVLNVARLYM